MQRLPGPRVQGRLPASRLEVQARTGAGRAGLRGARGDIWMRDPGGEWGAAAREPRDPPPPLRGALEPGGGSRGRPRPGAAGRRAEGGAGRGAAAAARLAPEVK